MSENSGKFGKFNLVARGNDGIVRAFFENHKEGVTEEQVIAARAADPDNSEYAQLDEALLRFKQSGCRDWVSPEI